MAMGAGQYRTKRLTVTKSYIKYYSKQIQISEIADVSQPKNDPPLIFLSLGLLIGAFLLLRENGWWLALIFGLNLLKGFFPPPILDLKMYNGLKQRIRLGSERNPDRAIHTIKANFQEYKHKANHSQPYVITPAAPSFGAPPEEFVRQYVLQLLTLKFGFAQADIAYEFPIKLGSSQKRADVVVFFSGTPHTQANIYIIVECKRMDRRDDSAAQDQLESYLAACANARYGVTATFRWRVTEKVNRNGMFTYMPIPALLDARGVSCPIDYQPGKAIEVKVENEVDEFLDDIEIYPVESKPKRILRGSLKYALVAGSVIAVFLLFLNNGQPSVPARPTAYRPSTEVSTSPALLIIATESAPTDTMPSISPTWTAPRFRTFTPSMPAYQPDLSSTDPASVGEVTDEFTEPTVPPVMVLATLAPATLTFTPTEPPSSSSFGVIQTTLDVNLRLTPSTRARVVAVLPPATRVEIIGMNDSGTWLQVRLGTGEVGWVAANLVARE
ncbi:MAG: type I restriction enzyme HsdR N-terminal domain-containing protein [Anaerolinea sp.]|nr:type I restriction enzyme HsdR N-terminal domain-containing protein [Anaerolinea sp.]